MLEFRCFFYESHDCSTPTKLGTPGSCKEAPGFHEGRKSLDYFFIFNNT